LNTQANQVTLNPLAALELNSDLVTNYCENALANAS